MDEISSVEQMQPTMGARRLLGSGGYMGYWGLYRDGELGNYTAYYGRGSDCFLIRMKNGDKFLLGCDTPKEMTDFISERISKRINDGDAELS